MKQTKITLAQQTQRRRYSRQIIQHLPFDQSVGYQVRIAQKGFVAELQARVAPFAVSAGMWFFLRILWQEDGFTQRELSRQVGLMEPTAFTTLANMEETGLIKRIRNKIDRRKVNIFLTRHGRSLRSKMLPIAREVNAMALQDLSAREIELLLDMLKRINRRLNS